MIHYLEVKDFPPPINYGDHHIMRLVRTGKFPPPIRIGRRKAWPEPVIEHFIASLPVAMTEARHRPCFTPEEARAAINKRWADHRARKAEEAARKAFGGEPEA